MEFPVALCGNSAGISLPGKHPYQLTSCCKILLLASSSSFKQLPNKRLKNGLLRAKHTLLSDTQLFAFRSISEEEKLGIDSSFVQFSTMRVCRQGRLMTESGILFISLLLRSRCITFSGTWFNVLTFLLPISSQLQRDQRPTTAGGTSSISVFPTWRVSMLLEISGKLLNREQCFMSTFVRDAKLMLVGRNCSLEHHDASSCTSLCRFEIEDGTSTKLVQYVRVNVSRLVAFQRFGISFKLLECPKFISLRFARGYMLITYNK